jgi:hypothetical protein
MGNPPEPDCSWYGRSDVEEDHGEARAAFERWIAKRDPELIKIIPGARERF